MEKDKKKIIAGAGILGGAGLAFLLLRRGKAAPPPPPPDKATLWGTVKDAQTNKGINGISINCNGYIATTESNGYYALENIEPGTYTVLFSDPLGRYEPLTI